MAYFCYFSTKENVIEGRRIVGFIANHLDQGKQCTFLCIYFDFWLSRHGWRLFISFDSVKEARLVSYRRMRQRHNTHYSNNNKNI